ncbi:MAG TPA: hypothetical protein VLT33_00940, partial [Labilithrix sp.]|nr:hypothetical protein [Labilithrix sp.]
MKNEPPRQLKTVPLTAAGLAAAQASAAALSKANSRDSKAPNVAAEGGAPSVRAVPAAGAAPTRKKASRGTTLTIVGIGVL